MNTTTNLTSLIIGIGLITGGAVIGSLVPLQLIFSDENASGPTVVSSAWQRLYGPAASTEITSVLLIPPSYSEQTPVLLFGTAHAVYRYQPAAREAENNSIVLQPQGA